MGSAGHPYRGSVRSGRLRVQSQRRRSRAGPPVVRNVGFRGVSVVGCSVPGMELITDLGRATEVAGSVCDGLDALRGSHFWKIAEEDLLTLAGALERVGRLV